MFKNYLKTAIRNLRRNKSYAVINVLGLAVGIAASLLIFLVIQFETSFDDFHSKKNSIYRVASEYHGQDGVDYSGSVSFVVGPSLKVDFPQIKKVTNTYRTYNSQIAVQEESSKPQKKFTERTVLYAEPEFFDIFDFGWLAGDPKTSLKDPNTAVLTQQVAEKYFGDWKLAIGKTIRKDNKTTIKITGVLKNIPPNTDFPLGVVVSYETMKNMYRQNLNDWVSTFGGAYTFVVLPSELPAKKFNILLKDFAKRHKPAEYASDTYISQPL